MWSTYLRYNQCKIKYAKFENIHIYIYIYFFVPIALLTTYQLSRNSDAEALNRKCVEEGLTLPASPYFHIPEMKLKCKIIRQGNIFSNPVHLEVQNLIF